MCALGLLTGMASIAATQQLSVSTAVASTEFSAASGSDLLERIAVLHRNPNLDEREAIRGLEPLLADAIDELQESTVGWKKHEDGTDG
ncbi:hypothetical protein [Brevibacterium zhoupengii]|uniref:hypothetical protein n=1 Tax=Brevibacterium zhoupengii TaxID=2898795 RepID=UPI001F09268C|nr:hypothetical protein [Brevibacterium zhoupengii]